MIVKVSVIVPVYNAEKYLHECINSVINQTLKEIEIICIDDGSTDSSLNILNEYAKKDIRILVLKQENLGSGKARNLGIDNAHGEFIAFMDADDLYPSLDNLSLLYNAAIKNNVKICGGSLVYLIDGKIETRNDTKFFKSELINYRDVQFDYGYYRYIYSASLLKENNIYFPDLLRYQDPPFMVRSMLMAKTFYSIPDNVYCYRYGHQKINWNERRINDLLKGLLYNLTFAKNNNLDILLKNTFVRIINEYGERILRGLEFNNKEILKNLEIINEVIKENFLQFKKNLNINESINHSLGILFIFYFYKINNSSKAELNKLQTKLDNTRNSMSYKIGRAITWLPRLINRKIKGKIMYKYFKSD